MTTITLLSTPQLTATTAADLDFEREKAAITSYEEGWDRWDGPIYPIGYVQCRMRKSSSFHLLVLRRDVEG